MISNRTKMLISSSVRARLSSIDVGFGVLDTRLDEQRQQIVVGLLAPLGDERRDVLRDRGGVADDVAARRHADGPVEELPLVLTREAERDTDRLYRHVGRHLFIEVGRAEGLDAQQVLVDDRLDDVALPALHLRLAERGLQQQAHASVLGLVHADHALADREVDAGP